MNKNFAIRLLLLWFALMGSGSAAQALPNIDRIAKAGRYRDVIAVCDRTLRRNPRDEEAYAMRGWACAALDLNAQALANSNRAIELDPGDEWVYVIRARALHELGNNAQSVNDCTKAINMSKKTDSWAYQYRGDAYCDLSLYKKAIADYDAVIRLRPDAAVVYGNRGWAHGRLGDYRSDIEDCDRAMAIDPRDAWAYRQRESGELLAWQVSAGGR